MSEGCSCISNASMLHWVVNTAAHSEADVMPTNVANANNYLQSMQRKIRKNYVIFCRGKKKKKSWFQTDNFMSKILYMLHIKPQINRVLNSIQSQTQDFGKGEILWSEWFGENRNHSAESIS